MDGPLAGVRILDLGTMFAGPLSATLLGDFGADVIKVEHPHKRDPARSFGPQKDGKSVYWKSLARNKRCITLNLSRPRGAELLLALAEHVDVIIESFRPGTLERWGLGWDELERVNPQLVLLRTSAFGPEGPYSAFAGYGTLAEAMSGFAHATGDPDGPPTLPQFPLADGIAGVFGALGIVAALYRRQVSSGPGQWIDNTIYEPIMRLIELGLSEYDQLGTIRGRHGNHTADSCPRGAYETAEPGRWVALSGSSTETAQRVFRAIGRDDMVDDPALATNPGRVANAERVNAAVAEWIGRHTLDEVLDRFRSCDAPVAPIYDAAGVFADEHFHGRDTLIDVPDDDYGSVKMLNVNPRLSATPGRVRFAGPDAGTHNASVYGELLGIADEELVALAAAGVI
jgi:crotonobetainyl-CoA:carnitine CoA-transferase CaiB-like acyl-CoA transferase